MAVRAYFPGVYVDVSDVSTTANDVTPDSLNAEQIRSLGAAIHDAVASGFPQWPDTGTRDPGVTLLKLFAWLAESMERGDQSIPDQGRAAALRAAAALMRLGRGNDDTRAGPLKRPRFFDGRLPDAASLQAEQDYHRAKLRAHNRALIGSGIVSGLTVGIEGTNDYTGTNIVIGPGYAIDRNGEEIAIPVAVTLPLPEGDRPWFVTVRFWEEPCDAMPTPTGNPVYANVEEACLVAISAEVTPPALALVRLVRADARWNIDLDFTPSIAGRKP